MEGNNAPFAIGQKVVCLVGGPNFYIHKGEIYTVKSCKRLCSCPKWVVDVGVANPTGNSNCSYCGHRVVADTIWLNSKYFAPIQTQYTDISKEIADSIKTTEEVPDIIKVPETVNN